MVLYAKIRAEKNAILNKILNNKTFIQKGWVVAEKLARKKYETGKKVFFKQFDGHPVTREIKRGPESDNSSGLLEGEGNLFSFFGFNYGEDPIEDVKFYLENSFSFNRGSYRQKQWNFKIKAPDKEQVEEYVVGKYGADYTSESWIAGVEKGYSGLNYYLRYSGRGRSKGGVQSSSIVNELTFKTTRYLSDMLSNFRGNITK